MANGGMEVGMDLKRLKDKKWRHEGLHLSRER